MGGPGSGRRKSPESIAREIVDAKGADAKKATPKKAAKKTTKRKSGETELEFVGFTPDVDRQKLYAVRTPGGADIKVQGKREQRFYKAQAAKYQEQNRFTHIADLADLDQLLMQELLTFRWSQQLASGRDYDGQFLQIAVEEQLRRNQAEAAKTIASIKRSLGLSRESRAESEGSVSQYLADLRRRAKEFGVHRNQQAVEAITLLNELSSIVGTFDRSNETERAKSGFKTEVDIIAWVRDHAVPKFNKIDAEFRSGKQKYWVGTL